MNRMQVMDVPLSEILPYETNPRINDDSVELVANSISAFGFQQPLVLDRHKVIVVGHTRYKAAVRLNLASVPCVIASDLTEAEARAYRLADNRLGELSDWNLDLLDVEMQELEGSGMDLSLFGFGGGQIDWNGVDDISASNYEEPDHAKLLCPSCGNVDFKMHFKAV